MAIAYDTSTVGGDGTVSYSHTCTGSNRFLIVTTGNRGLTISGVTYGGVSLTNLLNNEGGRLSVWYLIDPASGSNTVVLQGASGGDNVNSIAVSYTGAYGIDSSNVATAATPNTVATTVVDTGCWLIGSGYGATSSSATISTERTTRQTAQFFSGLYVIGAFDSNGTVSTGSQSITYTVGGVSPNTDIGLTYSITPNAPALGPANLKSYDTNLKANIKSINTNLIGNIKSLDTNV